MRRWSSLLHRLQSIAFPGRREADLREELQLHVDREIERLIAGGLSPDDARMEALRLFGGVEQIKEECRDARGTAVWDTLTRDARYALRRLRRDWRFTAAAVLLLGLGIGANTIVFSAVNAALFRPRAVRDPERLVDIYQNDRARRPISTSLPTYRRITGYTDLFSSVMATSPPLPMNYLHDGAVRSGITETATSTYLTVLGLQPSVGRWFDATEDVPGAAPVAVIGHETWTRTFGADLAVVGKTVRIEGTAFTIVGVGPMGHRGTIDIGLVTDFWVPTTTLRALISMPSLASASADRPFFLVKARLRDGRTTGEAAAAMRILGEQLAAERSDDESRTGISTFSSADVRIHPQADTFVTALAVILLVMVGLVLAIACSNLATLLLVRGASRAKEVSIRLALGATRGQLTRHLLTESVLLSLGGGAAGCLLAWWGVRIVRGLDLPFTVDITLDVRVLAFAVATSVITGVVFGLAPARAATRLDLLPTLRDEGTPPIEVRRLTLKNALIVFQVAVSVLLLGGTSYFIQLLSATRALPVAFAVDGVAMLETDVRYGGYTDAAARTFIADLERRVRALPGVQSVAWTRGRPMLSAEVAISLDSATDPKSTVAASLLPAGPGLIEALHLPLLHGRLFDARDRVDTPRVAVVSARMARELFGNENAVGRRFRSPSEPGRWTEVVGVVGDTGTGDFGDDVLDPIPPPFYVSHTQEAPLPTTLTVRGSSADASALLVAMQRELRSLDASLPIVSARTMTQAMAEKQRGPRAAALLLGILGILGLLLASIGLYAVIDFAVARRAREIGIRMALGALDGQVMWSVARGVFALVATGTAIGLVLLVLMMLALRATSMPESGLGDISFYRPEIDPVALLAIIVVMTLVGVAAAVGPARRAMRLDPLAALRHE